MPANRLLQISDLRNLEYFDMPGGIIDADHRQGPARTKKFRHLIVEIKRKNPGNGTLAQQLHLIGRKNLKQTSPRRRLNPQSVQKTGRIIEKRHPARRQNHCQSPAARMGTVTEALRGIQNSNRRAGGNLRMVIQGSGDGRYMKSGCLRNFSNRTVAGFSHDISFTPGPERAEQTARSVRRHRFAVTAVLRPRPQADCVHSSSA